MVKASRNVFILSSESLFNFLILQEEPGQDVGAYCRMHSQM